MNRKVALLGIAATALTATPAAQASHKPAWQHALAVRGDALNRAYHVGGYAVPRTLTAPTTPAWYRALELRSKALNERHRLGGFAPASAENGLDWTAAGFGAAVAIGVCILLAAAAVTARGRRVSRV